VRASTWLTWRLVEVDVRWDSSKQSEVIHASKLAQEGLHGALYASSSCSSRSPRALKIASTATTTQEVNQSLDGIWEMESMIPVEVSSEYDV
jgi:hypothetical protein